LVGECARVSSSEIACVVEPVIFPLESAFARTELEENRVEIDLGWSGPLAVSGPGAGGAPTATSLLGDLLASGEAVTDCGAGKEFTVVADPRAHSWLVAARVSARTLLRTLEGSGISIQSVRGSTGDPHVVTRPAAWAALQPVIAELAASNADPLIARVELPVVGRDAS
jgi:homoserine dehydrogenase